MRIVVAPDSFKGSLSALEVANAVEQGLLAVFPDAEVAKVPIADGGEGTVEALVSATGGQVVPEKVLNPLGRPIKSYWGILGDGETAVIEMAAASGLPLIRKDERDPRITSTYGTGQLIKAALDRGMKRIIIGIGGSATNDGGTGMARALGIKFLDDNGHQLQQGGAPLKYLTKVDLSGVDPRLAMTEITVACDVDNPLCGPRGASAVFGPQKGADPDMVKELDAALGMFAQAAAAATGRDVANAAGAGAAGGLGAGLLFFTNAQLRPGVEIVLETTGFAELAERADLIITGEGRTDFQTAYGKAPVGVAKVAKQFDVPVICLSGGLGDGAADVLSHGIDALMSVVPHTMTLDECMKDAGVIVRDAASRLGQMIKVGMGIKPGN